MANEYTPNYNLDLYTDNDKPNLRDQYNGAITKIDTQLHEFSNNMVIITDSANQAREKAAAAQTAADANAKSISTLSNTVTDMDSAYKEADNAITDAYKAADSSITDAYKAADSSITDAYKAADVKLSSDITTAYKAADAAIVNDYKAADTSMNDTLTNMINGHFPIKSDDIQAGAITRDKLDAQALESLIKGITIRRFDSDDGTADNAGLIVPAGGGNRLAGYYLPELTMLVLTNFSSKMGQNVSTFTSETTEFRLPSYVPHTTANIWINQIGIIYASGSDFKTWSGIGINKNGYVGVSSLIPSSANSALAMAGNGIAFLRAFGAA